MCVLVQLQALSSEANSLLVAFNMRMVFAIASRTGIKDAALDDVLTCGMKGLQR